MSTQDVTVLAWVNKLHLKSENGNIKYSKIKCYYTLRTSKRDLGLTIPTLRGKKWA